MYSRPSTSTVNALERISLPNAPSIIGDSRVTRSADGRVLDFRNPGQILRNAEARTAEVTNFISGLTKIAKPLVDDALLKQANNQVGELLATQDLIDLLRTANGDPVKQGLVRNLSPQARDIFKAKQAEASSYAYAESLSAERLKQRNILQNYAATPEQIAEAEAKAKANALESSGLNRLDPAYMVRYSDLPMKAEATLRAKDNEARVKAQDEVNKANYSNGLEASLKQLSELRVEYAKAGQAEEFSTRLRANLEKSFSEAPFLQSELADLWGQRITTQVQALRSARRYEDAWNLLQLLDGAAKVNPQAPGGGNFFDFKMQNGVPLRYLIGKLQDELYDEKKRWDQEQYLLGNMETLQRLAAGEDVDPSLVNSAILSARTPEQLAAFTQLANSMESYGTRITSQDELREAEFRMQLEDAKRQPGFDKQQWFDKAKALGLKPAQVLRLTGALNEEYKPDSAVAITAMAKQDMDDLATLAAANTAQKTGGEIKEQKLKAEVFATKETQRIVESLIASGEKVTRDQAAEIYQNALEGWARQTVNQKSRGSASTPAGMVQQQFMELESNLVDTGGRWTMNAFPKSVVNGWKLANPDQEPSVRDLQRYMIRLGMTKGTDGKPIVPNVEQRLRQMSIQAAPQGKAPGGQPDARPARMSLLGGVGASENMGITRPGQGKTQPAKARPVSGQEQAAQPQGGGQAQQQNPLVAFALKGLQSVANVITPPAAAGTLDVVENQEAIETLGKLWSGRERVRIGTPALPQVTATAPAAPVPLKINTPMHPLFVAIGIAEGTRTANGGFTKAYYGHRDPGDGHWNRGTVSGGRGTNASPQQVDRQWMAKLTKKSVTVAPLLRRAGAQPGTQGWNRLMFNILDLEVQSPLANQSFIKKLPQLIRQGASVEAIAKARADSFYNPRTGRLERSFNSYSRLLQDQRSRAGVWDYRRRL